MVTLLTEDELRQCAKLDARALQAVEDGFTALAEERVTQPPIMRMDIPEHSGEVDVKTAYIKGLDSFAVKLSAGFFENYKLDLPSGSGLMLLLNTETGHLQAVLLEGGYLTDVRTALAGAIAAKYLAPEHVHTVGVLGAGSQARYQLRALRLVRGFETLKVYSKTSAHAEKYAAEMAAELEVNVTPVETPREIVADAQIVITTTPAKTPILKAEWLHPGLHITAMGSDAEEKNELEPTVLAQADLLVCDVAAQCFRLGELHHGLEAGVISKKSEILELGQLTSGKQKGRTDEQAVTVCDLTGTGVQDTAIARLAYGQAQVRGLGQRVDG